MNPYKIVQDFESAICEYTGAPYCVVTTSCTAALLLACKWFYDDPEDTFEKRRITPWRNASVAIPAKTYVGVPQSVIHAGFKIDFINKKWNGGYRLDPLPVWDYARRFTSGMYKKGQMQCVSFHWTKILSVGQGGAILNDDKKADAWLRRARFDGRTEGVPANTDVIPHLGYHAYMSPRDAAEGISRLAVLPKHNKDLPNSDYPDLSKLPIFQCS